MHKVTYEQKETLLVTFFGMGLLFFAYRYGLIAMPTGDSVHYLLEWNREGTSFLSQMTHSLFFDRLRQDTHGDYYLFRPLTEAFLGLRDWFFRFDLLIQGLLSLGIHLLNGILLWRILRKKASFWVVLGPWLYFLLDSSAMEMVRWRHVTPYLLSVTFLLGAELAWQKNLKVWMTTLLLISCLFHESLALVLIAFCVLGLIKGWKKLSQFGLPAVIYFGLNGLDLIFHPVKRVFTDAEKFSGLGSAVYQSLVVAGTHLFSWIAPWYVRYDQTKYSLRLPWLFTQYPLFRFAALGGVLVFIYLGVVFLLLRKTKKNDIDIPFVWIWLGHSALLLISLGFLRAGMRGLTYVEWSPYYHYFTHLAWAYLFVNLIVSARMKRLFSFATAITAFVCIPRIWWATFPHSDFERSVANTTYSLHTLLKADSKLCIQKIAPELDHYLIHFNFARFFCDPASKLSLPVQIGIEKDQSVVALISDQVLLLDRHYEVRTPKSWNRDK